MSERARHTTDAPEPQLRERAGGRTAVDPPAAGPAIGDGAERLAGEDAQLIGQRYRLATPIGQGATGTVWRGWDEVLRRLVAIKEVRFPPGVSRAKRDILCWRTLREARTAAQLSHPAAATVHDVVVERGCPWIVMELIHGRPLDRVIKTSGPLPPSRVAELGCQILGALTAAHRAGVLHRDVKPSNVLITGDGGAVLTDFGIATMDGDSSLTQDEMVLGTPAYLAPERIRGDSATPATDMWSLGATLYAAVEGQGPYDRCGGVAATVAKVLSVDPPPLKAAGPLTAAISALLSRNPTARPSPDDAMAMLKAAAAQDRGDRSPGPWLRLARWVPSRAMAAVLACLIAALLASIWALSHHADRVPRVAQPGRVRPAASAAPPLREPQHRKAPRMARSGNHSAPVVSHPRPLPAPPDGHYPSPRPSLASGSGSGSDVQCATATADISANCYSPSSRVSATVTADPSPPGVDAEQVAQIGNGDILTYTGINFGSGSTQFDARVASGAGTGISGLVEVVLDNPSASPIASFSVASTGGWASWQTIAANMALATGKHTVYLEFVSSAPGNPPYVSLHYFTFPVS